MAGSFTGAAKEQAFVSENIAGKGEDADYQNCLLFLQCFQKASHIRLLKVESVL